MSMMNADELLSLQRARQDALIALGAFLEPLRQFLERCRQDPGYADDTGVLLRLKQDLGQNVLDRVDNFLKMSGNDIYFGYVGIPQYQLLHVLAQQTIDSRKVSCEEFLSIVEALYEQLSSVMMTIAQLPLPFVDVNLRARTPFQAYCFFRSILSEQAKKAYLFDPYVDASVFYLYLYALPSNAEVRIVTSPSKWKEKVRKEFEAVESLFKQEYPNYDRIDAVHDRHLIVNGVAYSLGGSLKDAAKKADFHVKEVSQEIGEELINKYIRSKESM
ncbi:hypothetical protein HRbin16_00887 [bacterium HR16]|nr:hypothetical protein HRbin16_00887 [bacterium HR16]